ncbi:hypothetical protein MKZ38_010488 [Zalerion maritima]|uniref:Uncharacterized protein n=1 Tax=Zalerion maritima TaxID=339359 RepID=A0AAD5RS85_9PEZI|nr:hypothetical protein MKZ38_010488 [Zalerion maritima]
MIHTEEKQIRGFEDVGNSKFFQAHKPTSHGGLSKPQRAHPQESILNMKSINPFLAVLLSLSPLPGLCVPDITAIPLSPSTTTCSGWPQALPRTPDSDSTSYIRFVVAHSDDPGIDGLVLQPRNFSRTTYSGSFPNGTTAVNTNLVVDLLKSNRYAKSVYRCNDGLVGIGASYDPPIWVYRDRLDAQVTTREGGYPLQPYKHVDASTGQEMEGAFLGALNQTTWGFNYVRPGVDECQVNGDGTAYFEARLQGLPLDESIEHFANNSPQFFGFIQAKDWPPADGE